MVIPKKYGNIKKLWHYPKMAVREATCFTARRMSFCFCKDLLWQGACEYVETVDFF
jgi:hypothetical protein